MPTLTTYASSCGVVLHKILISPDQRMWSSTNRYRRRRQQRCWRWVVARVSSVMRRVVCRATRRTCRARRPTYSAACAPDAAPNTTRSCPEHVCFGYSNLRYDFHSTSVTVIYRNWNGFILHDAFVVKHSYSNLQYDFCGRTLRPTVWLQYDLQYDFCGRGRTHSISGWFRHRIKSHFSIRLSHK